MQEQQTSDEESCANTAVTVGVKAMKAASQNNGAEFEMAGRAQVQV